MKEGNFLQDPFKKGNIALRADVIFYYFFSGGFPNSGQLIGEQGMQYRFRRLWYQQIQVSWRRMLPVAGTGEGDDAVEEGREEGAVAMLNEERAARSAWTEQELKKIW